jgi:hypothetical protein
VARTSALAFAILLAGSMPAAAQSPTASTEPAPDVAERAHALFDQGVALTQEERWTEALDAFRASRALVERPSTLFNIATTLQRLGRNRDAIDAVDAFVAAADPVRDGAQIDQARALRVALRESLAEVTVHLRPGTAEVFVDARPAPAREGETDARTVELDPGEHVIEARSPGFTSTSLSVTLAPGERSDRELALERIPSTPAELSVHASRSDATIVVDEEPVGAGEAELQLAAGTHVVRVEAPEHRTFQQLVVLGPAERLTVEAPLERVSGGSITDEPAFWIVGGVLLAGIAAGVTAGVIVASSSTPSPYGGTGGFTVGALTW